MAVLYITEFSGQGLDSTARSVPVGAQPPTQEQTLAITSSSATPTNVFKNNTRLVRLHTDAICAVEFGTSPTAVVAGTGAGSARMAANQTEYYTIPPNSSYTVAVIATT